MSNEFPFRVDPKNPIAVYAQIQNLVQFAIASGRAKPGDTLPTIRDWSDYLGVNANTVTKALRDLELKGYVTTRRGVGVKVAANAQARCKAEVHEMARRHLKNAVGECAAAGLTNAQIQKIVTSSLASGFQPYGD